MPAALVENILSSPLVASAFLAAATLLILGALSKNDTDGVTPWFYAAVSVFVLRDLARLTFPAFPVRIVADSIVPALAAGLAAPRARHFPAIIVGAAAGAALAAAFSVGAAFPALARAVPLAAALAAVAYAAIAAADEAAGVRPLSTLGRIGAAVALVLPPLVSLVLPTAEGLRDRLVSPLASLLILNAALHYARVFETKLLNERDYLTDTIDTLYGFVLRASDTLHGGADLDRLLNYVASTLREQTHADGSLVFMIDDFEDLVVAHVVHGDVPPIMSLPEDLERESGAVNAWMRELRLPLGQGLIGETAQTGKAAMIPVAAADPRVAIDPAMPVGSVIAVPFLINDRVIGVGVVVRKEGGEVFADADFDRASLLADFASLVINDVFSLQETSEKGDIDREAGIASDIQRALQPKRVADLPNASFGYFSVPARGVNCDYFDVIQARKDRVYLVAGDVAGKGVPASLIMVMMRAILHLVVNTDKDAATILNWINRGITGKIELDHFATLQIIAYDPTTGACEYANAGHKPPLLWKESTGLVDAVEMESVPIGVEKGTEYSSIRFNLENGDVLVLYTDGVVDAINPAGKQYGMKSLTTMLHKFHELPPKEMTNKISVDVRAFIGDARQHDDQTLMAMKVKL